MAMLLATSKTYHNVGQWLLYHNIYIQHVCQPVFSQDDHTVSLKQTFT